MRFYLLVCFLFGSRLSLTAQDYNVVDFGAKPDGISLNTTNIQSAIDAANKQGGGRVLFPKGKFLSGSIVLKSGVELHLVKGAILLGSTDPAHYFKLKRWKALILADGEHNMAITGPGEIDGQGRQLALHIDSLFYAGQLDSVHYNFIEMRPSHLVRPQLIEFVNCKGIEVTNVTLRNAACWVQTYDRCENVFLDHVRVESDAYWNNDGIDIQDCRNVRITNCLINASDDGICLKSQSSDSTCDSIYIAHCSIRSSASAIKFGTVSHGGFRNVTIEHIKIFDTFRSAVAIECVDGGVLENVLIDHITAVNTGNALFIRLGERTKKAEPGTLRNVTIRNLKVEVPFGRPDEDYEIRGPSLPFFHNTFPSSITGIPGQAVENVILENIEIRYPGGGNRGMACLPIYRLRDVPEKEAAYPEFSMFGELPAWGLYVRHMEGLTMKNIKLSIKEPDYRPALVLDDVRQCQMTAFQIKGDSKDIHVVLHKSQEVNMDNHIHVLKL